MSRVTFKLFFNIGTKKSLLKFLTRYWASPEITSHQSKYLL